MNNLDKKYTDLLQDILDNGVKKQDRTGTGTLSVFGRQIRHKMSEGFPLITTKKMYFKGIVTELLWFLRGDTNIKYLVDNDCHIWDGDCYQAYLKKSIDKIETNSIPYQDLHLYGTIIGATSKTPRQYTKEEFINKIKTDADFAKKWGDLGPIYGKQWRSWTKFEEHKDAFEVDILEENEDSVSFTMDTSGMIYEIDQIQNLISDLKTNPDSRRLMVSAWNVGEMDSMTLPPCHYGFQVYTRELSLEERVQYLFYKTDLSKIYLIQPTEKQLNKENIPTRAISLMWNQRSVDSFLGLPFNIASYGLLLEIIAKEVNMVPDELIGNLGDTHLYLNHIEQAKEQIGRELSWEERYDLMPSITGHSEMNIEERKKINNFVLDDGTSYHKEWLDSFNIPTRTREPYPLPKLNIKLHFNNEPSFVPEHWLVDDFEIANYKSHSPIKAPLSN